MQKPKRIYKLTSEEARALATKVANESCKINDLQGDLNKWMDSYMRTFGRVMDTALDYNAKIDEQASK